MFKFEVDFWDEDIQEPNFENGIVSGESFGVAADRVADYYGQENIVSLTLEELDNFIIAEDVDKIFKLQGVSEDE